ncbi:hypothetical protein C9426_29685 [Serratia sp. S1B]|nr:hypothetical protein C9426_29685 [Serratia sp. S1B]
MIRVKKNPNCDPGHFFKGEFIYFCKVIKWLALLKITLLSRWLALMWPLRATRRGAPNRCKLSFNSYLSRLGGNRQNFIAAMG